MLIKSEGVQGGATFESKIIVFFRFFGGVNE